MYAKRTSVVSVIELTQTGEERLFEQFSDLQDGENIYLEICEEESKHFTSLTTFHGMIRIFLSRTWASLIFWVLVVCTCLVFYMLFSFQLLINYSNRVTFQKISTMHNTKHFTDITFCGARLLDLDFALKMKEANKCNRYRIPLIENRARLKLKIFRNKGAYMNMEEFDHLPLRTYHSHFLHLEPSQIFRLNSTRSHCVTEWDELKWVQRAPNLTYSYKTCEAAKRILLMTQIGHDPNDFWCYPPCEEIVHRKSFSYLKQRNNLTYLMIEYDRKGLVKRETRKMTIVDVLSLIGGGTSLFLGCSCVTLMETFVFLFKLIVQGLTREVETPASEEGRSTVEKAVSLERAESFDSDDCLVAMPKSSEKKMEPRPRRRSSAPIVVTIPREKRRGTTAKKDNDLMTVDSPTNPPDPSTNAQPDSDLEHHPIINEGKSSSKSHSTLGERILTRVLQRQPAVDVPDEIGDHNAKVLQSQASFVLDDFTSHPRAAKNILRRASTATSKASARSSRSLKVLSHVPQKRRTQIFSKHLLMNDF